MSQYKNTLDELESFLPKYEENKRNLERILVEAEIEITKTLNFLRNSELEMDLENSFQKLADYQFILAKLLFADELRISEGLKKFVHDFDRVDDDELKAYLLAKIKSGEYDLKS
ncbi:MAG TPA: hypothetical protein VGO50_19505 [Pyrinomonadaceae bacterium]|jgi:hypothetical protein|nr:hypothetical protein [Pyrinomonadaceae bacterium]